MGVHIFWPVHMLGVPRTKFYLAGGSRVTLSLLLVGLPIEASKQASKH